MPRLTVCPFSLVVFLATAYYVTEVLRKKHQNQKTTTTTDDSSINAATSTSSVLPPCRVVFVLGGPGAGKGTTCELLQQRLTSPSWAHLSTGDLLRAARTQGGPLGEEINSYIHKGQLVPSEVTCRLLEQGMLQVYRASGGTTNFLIDGFPRSFSNATVWQETMALHKVEFVLNLECPEEVLLGRLINRGQTSGRTDDTLDVIKKRFQTNTLETAPILEHFQKLGQVKTVVSDKPVEDVYREVAALFVGL